MIKKFISIFCLFAFISIYTPVFALNVPANTSILISPVNTVTSKDRNVSTVPCYITEDVKIDGVVVFKAGDRAELHVEDIEKARCWGKGGRMLISNGYAYDVHGQKHKILFSRNLYGEDKTWPKACGIVSLFFLWPLALCGFVHGDQAHVSAASEMETFLASQYDF
jgi:hypothetical protein